MKADKEEVMDAMALKADQDHFDTKISHGQFSEICEGILRDIQEVILVVSQKVRVTFRVTQKFNYFHGRAVDYEITVHGQRGSKWNSFVCFIITFSNSFKS